MTQAILDHRGIATTAGDLTIYNIDSGTREYLASSVEYLAVGVGIPANSFTDVPGKSKAGYAIRRTADLSAWEYVVDHRGKTFYHTETGEVQVMSALGEYPAVMTLLAPTTEYDKWNGREWVTDESARQSGQEQKAENKKAILLADAQSAISLWQTELQLGIITDEDKATLTLWIKYIQSLRAIDTSTAPDITWPDEPA
ncbi:phage tail protein [Lonsdalea britannica]|uniref:tail fiber assembly protein n=1 Tax=Lonsdalea britannica TaxID=1082704 RepID=UPI000A1F4FE4|nr:tail fiber assembly protein [Lonsdalea britannica]OSN03071.1 phage tail protein [Lonsdalea britannica]